MGGAIHELRARGISLLEPYQFIDKLIIAGRRYRIPPGIWHEATMEQVETSQIFDVETACEMVSQLGRCKQMKAECHMSAVTEVDFTPVPDVILFQSADSLARCHKSLWSAASRTHRRDEMSRRNARDLH